MSTINTNDLRVRNSQNFLETLNVSSNEGRSFVFVGRAEQWPDDNVPPPPQNNFVEYYNTWDNIFTLHRLNDTEGFHMIPRVTWTSGAVYDRYQHNYSDVNRAHSGADNLYDAVFVVINRTNDVYVCLDNNDNGASTVEPLTQTGEVFTTSDGYQWLRVYSIPQATIEARSTNNLIPITLSAVSKNAKVDGGVYTVLLDQGGAGYTINPMGASNQVTEYYCHINGDGSGAAAKVTITASSITDVEIVRNGSGYTFASLNFTANNVYASLSDMDKAVNGLDPEGDGSFSSTVIIGPPGGWGADLPRQLGGTRVGLFSTMGYDMLQKYVKASFRQIGVIQDLIYEGQDIALTTPDNFAAAYAIKATTGLTGQPFIVGGTIEQDVTVTINETGPARTETRKAKGTVIGWDEDNDVLRYTQSRSNVDTDGQLYRFTGDNPVTQTLTSQTLSIIPDITYTDTTTDLIFTDGYSNPTVVKYTGEMTYLANISPVVADDEQKERINLFIAF